MDLTVKQILVEEAQTFNPYLVLTIHLKYIKVMSMTSSTNLQTLTMP